MGEQFGDRLEDRGRQFIGEAEDEKARMGPGWVGPDVAEALVEGDEQAVLGQGRCRHLGVWAAGQVLGDDRVDLVVVVGEPVAQGGGQFSSSLTFTPGGRGGRAPRGPARRRRQQPPGFPPP